MRHSTTPYYGWSNCLTSQFQESTQVFTWTLFKDHVIMLPKITFRDGRPCTMFMKDQYAQLIIIFQRMDPNKDNLRNIAYLHLDCNSLLHPNCILRYWFHHHNTHLPKQILVRIQSMILKYIKMRYLQPRKDLSSKP